MGEIRLAFDRPVDGMETANAPAAHADETTALEAVFHRGLAQTFTPRFSNSDSSIAASGSYQQARSSPIATLPSPLSLSAHLKPSDCVRDASLRSFRVSPPTGTTAIPFDPAMSDTRVLR